MPDIPQAPRWEDPESVKLAIRGYRKYHNISPEAYSDYQVGLMLNRAGPEYKGIAESPAMRGEIFEEHFNKAYPFLENNPQVVQKDLDQIEGKPKQEKIAGLTNESRFAGEQLSETLFGIGSSGSRLYGEGGVAMPAITWGLSLIDQDLADGWQRAYRQGYNESITGLASTIITGDVPFEINERGKDEQDTAGAWVEGALSFGMSMLYDWYFFLGTKGMGLTVHAAGQGAKRKAAESLARNLWGKEIMNQGSKIGLKEMVKESGEEATQKYIKSAIRQGRKKGVVRNADVDSASKSLIQKMTDDGFKVNTKLLDDVAETSIRLADDMVVAKLSSPGLSGTIKSIGGLRLAKGSQINVSKLRQLTRHLGTRGALGFGLYEMITDMGDQWTSSIVGRINPATGEPYSEGEANNIYNRFMTDYYLGEDQSNVREKYGLPEFNPDGSPMDWNLINNDWKRTFSATMHGMVGAYTASAVGGVFKAGRDGKFIRKGKDGKPKKTAWNEIQKEYGDIIYNKAAEIGTEAAGFTGSTMILDGLLQKMGLMDEPEQKDALGKQFLHNLVTVGVLKGFGHLKKTGAEVMTESTRQLAKKIDKKVAEKIDKYNEVEKKFGDTENEFDANFKKEVKERRKKITKEAEVDIAELKEKVKNLNKVLEEKSAIDIEGSSPGKIKLKKKGYKTIVDPETGKRIKVPNMTLEEVSSLRNLINEVTQMKDKLLDKYDIQPSEFSIGGKKYKLFEAFEKDVAGQGSTGEMFRELERQVRKAEGDIGKKGLEQVLSEKQVEADKIKEAAKKKAETEERLSLISEIKEQSPLKFIYDEKGREVPFEKATMEQLRGRADGIRKSKQVTEKDSRVREYDNMSDNLKIATFGKTIANKVTTTIKNTKGPLGDIYKKLVSMAQDGISTKAIETQMTMARNFENFLAKKGIQISEGTVPLMNEFLNSGNKGKPFANPGGTGSAQHYAKFVMASIKGGRYSDYKLDHKATKSKRNPLFPEEYFDAQVSFREVFKKVSGVFKVRNKEVNYEVAHAINLIVGKLGSRSDFIFGGTGAINKKLKVGDVTEGPKFGNVKTIQIKFKGKTTKEGEIVWQFLDTPMGKEGINYYKVFKNLTKGKDAKADLITNKDGSTFTKAQYSEFAKDFLTKGKEGATGHTLRNTILSIGEKMDLAVSQGSTGLAVPKSLQSFGKSWKQIADGLFLTHKQETTMADRYGSFYENSPAHLQAKMTLFNKFYQLAEKTNLRETPAQKKKRLALEKAFIKELSSESKGKQQIITKEFASEQKEGKPFLDRIINTKTGEIIAEQFKLFIKEKPSDWMKEEIAKNRKKYPREVNILRDMQAETFAKMSKVSEGSAKYEIYKKRLEQYSRLEKQALKRKLQAEVENPSREKAVNRILDIMVQRNPGLKVILRDKGPAGEWVDGLMKITMGKADSTTFFHENVHRLETVIRETKNKKLIRLWEKGEKDVINYARRNHPELYKLYEKNYSGKELANELLTQLSAESALRQFHRESTFLGRRVNWVNSIVSRLKNYFGFGSMKDITRQYGTIARKGFSTDGLLLSLNQPKYQDMKDSKPTTQQEMAYEGSLKTKGIDGSMVKFLIERIPGLRERYGKDIIVNKNGTLEGNISAADLQILTDMINLIDDRAFKVKRSKAHSLLLKKAHLSRIANGITKEQSKKIANVLGIPKGSLKFATEKQLKAFKDFTDKVKVKYDPYEGVLQETIMEDLSKMNRDVREMRDTGMMKSFSTDVVLRKWGLTKLADRLLDHYQTEGQMTGIGLDAIWRANNLYKNFTSLKGVKARFIAAKEIKEYAPFALDPSLLEPTMIDGRRVSIKSDKGRDKFIEQSKIEGTKEYETVKILRKMYNDYYNAFMEVSLSNIKNPAMKEAFKEKYQPKFVQDYFTRVLSKEARKLLRKDDSKFAEIQKKIEIDMFNARNRKLDKEIDKYDSLRLENNRGTFKFKEYDKIVKQLTKEQAKFVEDFKDKNSEVSQEITNEALNYLRGMVDHKTYTIDNKFLHDRQPKLDNILVDSKGRKVQTYETDFEKVFNKYQRNMSSFIATAKHLPEFTAQLKPYLRGSGKQADISRDMLRSLDQGDYAHRYVSTVINRQIGNVPLPTLGERFWSKSATGSAVIGLSSTLSGVKNFMIGSNMTIGVMGAGNYVRALSELHRGELWVDARRMGRLQFGTKEVELGKWSELIGRKISLMNTTESINRIVGSRAGELTAMQLFKNIRNEGSMLRSVKSSEAKLNRLFRLNAEEIAHIKKYGFMEGEGLKGVNKKRIDGIELERARIIEKIRHYGHITTQGASGNPFLPLWASSGTGKALTLFYRMAYSGTANIWHHIIKPAKQGDLLPLMRYPMAAALSGGAYWSLMESILGVKNPKANEDQLAILGANLSKAETLGIYSFLLNPYSSGELGDLVSPDLLTQPAIIRNMVNLASLFNDLIIAGKTDGGIDIKKSFRDLLNDSVTAAGHYKKYRQKKDTPFKTNNKALRTFRFQYHRQLGEDSLQKYNDGNIFSEKFNKTERTEMYNLIKEAFQGSDEDIKKAAHFYMATWFTIYDKQRFLESRLGRNHKKAKQFTDSALKQVIKKINPMHFSDQKQSGLVYNEKLDFIKYLSPENRLLAKKTEEEYWYRKRKFDKYLKEAWSRHGGYYKRGEIMQLLPFPPQEIDNEFKLKQSGAFRFGKPPS